MLKKRIAALLIVKEDIVVQSIGFKKYLPVGRPDIAIEFLNSWGIDEIIYLDISASKKNRSPNFSLIKNMAKKCQVPLTVGGGIKSVEDIRQLLHCGADKVSLNNILFSNSDIVTKAAHVFGDQCIIASIDAIMTNSGYRVYDYQNATITDLDPFLFSKQMQEKGAGEVLINSVDQDGSYKGFDINLINGVCSTVSVPVICAGGARGASDFIDVFNKTSVCAAGAGNFFHFTEHSVNTTKSRINKAIPIRLETHADYQEAAFDENGRLLKQSDTVLENKLFTIIEKEII